MRKLNSLRVKLTAFFLIPVIFIMIVGFTAYTIASKGMQETYESNAVTALEQVAKTRLPFLFIHGDKDDFVPYIMMRPLFEACASEDKKSVTIKDSAHAENYYTDPETYWGEIESWLDKYLV